MKKAVRTLALIGVVTVIAMLLPWSVGSGLRQFGRRLTTPLTRTLHGFGSWLDTRYTNLTTLGRLHEERDQLRVRVIELEQQVAELANASHENELLRRELGVKDRVSNYELVQATVVSRVSNNPNGEALVDQGSRSGVAVGQAVVSEGTLVGKITEVSPSGAVLTLVTSPRSQVQAEVVDTQRLGLVKGSPTGLRLTEIDPDTPLDRGMIIQTSGITLNGQMPRGLVIGQVDRVTSPPNQSSQEAIIHTPIDFDQLRLVFVVIPR